MIVIVSAFYSEGMSYSENCLSRTLASRGHEVHVVTSTYNVYGNEALYETTYRDFLGPAQVAEGTTSVDGYQVHRLPTRLVGGYVWVSGLGRRIAELAPDVVHSLEVASLQTFELAARRPFGRYRLFSETHQQLSVVKPYMRQSSGAALRKLGYRLTRTLPSKLASTMIEKVYAISPDAGEVAIEYYGVPRQKVVVLSLGTDTDRFHPVQTDADRERRRTLRTQYGFRDEDIVSVYTGRFTRGKDALALARAIERLIELDPRFKGVFIGEGEQKRELAAHRNCIVLPFMKHDALSEHYRAFDIGVWPTQESVSQLDAAASGLPIVVSSKIGEPQRVTGNGKLYEEGDLESLVEVIRSFGNADERRVYGEAGRRRMLRGFSWTDFARIVEADYFASGAGER